MASKLSVLIGMNNNQCGWYYLSTVIDDYSRYIVSWRLCTGMAASDVVATLKNALKAAGLTRKHRPRLLSDNGPCYINGELKGWLEDHGMPHTRGKPYHPMTQGKIERWHRTMKDKILLEHYYMLSELESRIGEFINQYNTRRYHESLNYLTPEGVWLGRGEPSLSSGAELRCNRNFFTA